MLCAREKLVVLRMVRVRCVKYNGMRLHISLFLSPLLALLLCRNFSTVFYAENLLRINGNLLPTTPDAGTLEDLGSPIQPGTSPIRYMGLMACSLLDHEKSCKCLYGLQ